MSNDADPREADEGAHSEPDLPDAVASTGSYETEEGTVFYDVENPLAWLQSEETESLRRMA